MRPVLLRERLQLAGQHEPRTLNVACGGEGPAAAAITLILRRIVTIFHSLTTQRSNQTFTAVTAPLALQSISIGKSFSPNAALKPAATGSFDLSAEALNVKRVLRNSSAVKSENLVVP